MQTTWTDVLNKMLQLEILVEDEKGIIQISPIYYKQLGRPLPGTVNPNKERAAKLAQSYIDLWPKKVTSGGRPVRQGPTTIIKKLNVFLNKNPKFTDAQILGATARYVHMKQKENWEYTCCSDYFISKNDSSLLESFILDSTLGSKDEGKAAASLNQRFV